MFEKVNPCHPDKVLQRCKGKYLRQDNLRYSTPVNLREHYLEHMKKCIQIGGIKLKKLQKILMLLLLL